MTGTPTSPDWPALDRLLEAAFARAGLSRPASLAPWVALAAKGGPTPRRGPLTHDVVLPHREGRAGLGLNLFRYPATDSVDLARQWAREALGLQAAGVLTDLLDRVPAGIEVQPGVYFDAGGERIKLYFGAHRPEALPQLGVLLGVEGVATSRGMAVDLRASGFERAREYRRIEPGTGELASLGQAAIRWGRLARGGSELRHCMLGTTTSSDPAEVKRTLVQTFAPDAPVEALVAFESALAASGVALPRPLDVEWLGALAADAAAAGQCLYAVAHELDLHADGRLDSDLFVTLGCP